jgi:hypothetical protein
MRGVALGPCPRQLLLQKPVLGRFGDCPGKRSMDVFAIEDRSIQQHRASAQPHRSGQVERFRHKGTNGG